MRFYYSADCTLMAAGTIRGDQIYPPGVLKLRDIVNCFPFEDPVVVIRLPGSSIVKAIENGISKLPAFEGRFPHVSNIYFTYDPSLPAGSRIVSCKIGEEDLVPDKKYTLATRGYMANGKDGFSALTKEGGGAEDVVDEENGVLISMILRQYFLSLKVMGKWRRGGAFRQFFGGLKNEMADKGELVETEEVKQKEIYDDSDSGSDDDDEELEGSNIHESDVSKEEKVLNLIRKAGNKWARLAGVRQNEGSEELAVDWTRSVAPRIEGRIKEVKK
jgi:5'-nucleotidase